MDFIPKDLHRFLPELSVKNVAFGSLALSTGYMLYEQLRFLNWRRKSGGSIAGPSWAIPVIGSIVEMVVDPYGFWEKQRLFSPSGLSWNSIAGQFMVFSTDVKTTHKIMSNNGPDSFLLYLHPNGWQILGEHNIAFIHGPEHKALRRSFLNLFLPKALGVYLKIQDRLIREHLSMWMKETVTDHVEIRNRVRDLNLMTSQTVFIGPYLKTEEQRQRFCNNYLLITLGFLSFPIAFPGSGLWKAIRARHEIVDVLTRAAKESKQRMAEGEEPQCLLDFWSQVILGEIKEAEANGVKPPKHSSDWEMGNTMMDFLFASQDASTASLTWVTALMDQHPDILARVREEQMRVRPENGQLSYETLEQLPYTRQVIMEVLRYRPPAVMVPQICMQDFQLTDEYTCPKGALVVPSIWAACMQGFPDAHKFDPERMGPERREDVKYRENFLTFGAGPHYCVGRQYAINHLITYLSILSLSCNWDRKHTAQSDQILYLPTIYPADCLIKFSPRAVQA